MTKDVKKDSFLCTIFQWIVQRMRMEKLPEIKINSFQLAVLLDEAKKLFYKFVIENLVFCAQCRETAHEGIDVTEVYLTASNDVRVRGRCRKCDGEVIRLFAFGGNKMFYEKACRLRESIR
ncbi:MAG: hypothetical protein WCZ46_08775 [Proteiniphilum sp.]